MPGVPGRGQRTRSGTSSPTSRLTPFRLARVRHVLRVRVGWSGAAETLVDTNR